MRKNQAHKGVTEARHSCSLREQSPGEVLEEERKELVRKWRRGRTAIRPRLQNLFHGEEQWKPTLEEGDYG